MSSIPAWKRSSMNGSATKTEAVDISSADHTATIVPTGLHVGAAGTVVGQLQEDETDQTFVMVAGFYPYSFKKITKIGTSTGMGLVLVEGRN